MLDWLQTVFDGFIGAIIGGAVTAWAVLHTLRSDRKNADAQSLDTATARLATEVALVVSMMVGRRLAQAASHDTYGRFLATATEVIARAHKEHKEFASVIQDLTMTVVKHMSDGAGTRFHGDSTDKAMRHLIAIQGACNRWIRSPNDFKGGKLTAAWLLKRGSSDD